MLSSILFLCKGYSTFLLPSLVEKLWADVEIQLVYKEKKMISSYYVEGSLHIRRGTNKIPNPRTFTESSHSFIN